MQKESEQILEYHDKYVQNDTTLLADAFESFWKFMKVYFHLAPAFPWPACLKKTRVKVELLMDIDMLLMAEKTPWVECVILYIALQKEITNTWKPMTPKI